MKEQKHGWRSFCTVAALALAAVLSFAQWRLYSIALRLGDARGETAHGRNVSMERTVAS
jgi:hypothetical protein